MTYKVYGDRIDGTYLAIDPTHAHMNMPATLMGARGMKARPARVTERLAAYRGARAVGLRGIPTRDSMRGT